VVDPPWEYKRTYDPDASRVANPYPSMSLEEIKNINLPNAKDSILWLWATQAYLYEANDILKNWGYEYKATLVWNKDNMGMGNWLRMQCEFCLLGIKGKPIYHNTKYRDIITEKGREHSRKPESFYNMVNDICIGTKLDYFSREKRKGWYSYGNEIDKF
jgi:N6-adenosine-specific RNA methylase IME4